MEIILPKSKGIRRKLELVAFAEAIEELSRTIGFRISSRGWCYQLETARLINKDQFDLVEGLINECRKTGLLPVDFTAEEEARKFSVVEIPDKTTPEQFMRKQLEEVLETEWYYTPNWWKGEQYYIQMLVEKVDLKTLFEPVCEEYMIPIATAKGWSSILQRAEYAKRFKQAEAKGLKCVILYCGDHDPDGLRISEFIRSNLKDIQDIRWDDRTEGYDPFFLTIDRFGLNYDFIEANNLTWIDNLITGSKRNLADPKHRNYHLPYLQNYLTTIGARKCEANAIVVKPKEAAALCRQAIEKYLGENAAARFRKKRIDVCERLAKFRKETGLTDAINEAIQIIDDNPEE